MFLNTTIADTADTLGNSPGRAGVDNITRLLYFKLVLQLGKFGGYIFSGVSLFDGKQLSGTHLAVLGLLLILELVLNLGGFASLKQRWLKPKQGIFMLLLADIIFLVSFLHFFGGATNPFISLLLLPVAISATLLRPNQTWLLSFAAVVGYSLLMPVIQELGQTLPVAPLDHSGHDMQHSSAISTGLSHFWGMWANFLISVSVLTLFVVSMSRALRQRDRQLAEFRQDQLRNEQAVALGTMAATAAHELATPLSTMQLISDELAYPQEQEQRQQQLSMMAQQLQRCQSILTGLRQSTHDLQQNRHQLLPCHQLLDQLIEQWLVVRPEIRLTYQPMKEQHARMKTNPTLLPALMNLLDNAADASLDNNSDEVDMRCHLNDHKLQIVITDRGTGISQQYLNQHKKIVASSKSKGMGIGLFLANTSIEKLNGQVRLENQSQGMLTIITLPLSPQPLDGGSPRQSSRKSYHGNGVN